MYFRRTPMTLVSIVFALSVFMLLIILSVTIYDAVDNNNDSASVSSFSINKCNAKDVYGIRDGLVDIPCETVVFSPSGNAFVADTMRRVASLSGLSFGEDVVGFPSTADMATYLGGTTGVSRSYVVSFDDIDGAAVGSRGGNVSVHLYYNSSIASRADAAVTLQQAILFAMDNTADTSMEPASLTYRDLPSPSSSDTSVADEPSEHHIMMIIMGFTLFIVGMTTTALIFKSVILAEKSTKTLAMMRMMGMSESTYWITWYLTIVVLGAFSSLFAVSIGNMTSYAIFERVDFGVHFVNFWLYFVAMCSMAMFLSAVGSTESARKSSFGFFVVVLVTAIIFNDVNFNYKESTSPALFILYFFLPWLNFQKVFFYKFNYTQVDDGVAKSFHFDQLGDDTIYSCNLEANPNCCDEEDCFTARSDAFALWFMFGASLVYVFLSWYTSQVRDDGLSTAQPFYFPFLPEYWGFTTTRSAHDIVDGDAIGMERFLSQKDQSLRTRKLTKSYKEVTAVKELSIQMNMGEVCVILGHNGAGKSTTINMLNGLTTPTFGEGFIFGHSIKTESNVIQRMIGNCPQHNILWESLTAYDHLMLFGSLRGLPQSSLPAMIEEKLSQFYLRDMMHKSASSMSGGMKRRLCMAIATLGSPRIVFLDEPTTGMDPLNKHRVWEAIRAMKKDKIVVLTTHSMEEADFLGDRIAMMKGGRLRALGTPLFLKTHYGSGYQIRMLTHEASTTQLEKVVADHIPRARVLAANAGNVTIGVPRSSVRFLPKFFGWLQTARLRSHNSSLAEHHAASLPPASSTATNSAPGGSAVSAEDSVSVSQWTFSNTTLEEVFLQVCADNYELNEVAVNPDMDMDRVCVLCSDQMSEDVTLWTKDQVGVTVSNTVCRRCSEYGKYAEDAAAGKVSKDEMEIASWWDEDEIKESSALLKKMSVSSHENVPLEGEGREKKSEKEKAKQKNGGDVVVSVNPNGASSTKTPQVRGGISSVHARVGRSKNRFLSQSKGIILKNFRLQFLTGRAVYVKLGFTLVLLLITYLSSVGGGGCKDNALLTECSVASRIVRWSDFFSSTAFTEVSTYDFDTDSQRYFTEEQDGYVGYSRQVDHAFFHIPSDVSRVDFDQMSFNGLSLSEQTSSLDDVIIASHNEYYSNVEPVQCVGEDKSRVTYRVAGSKLC